MSLLSLSFSAPWALLALAGAPALWLLLRVTPPPPQKIAFPPLRLLRDLREAEPTPARTPLWLLILRLLLAGAIVLAMAGPLFAPQAAEPGARGPLLILVDDGWTAAADWSLRINALEARLDEAARQNRPAALIAFSDPPHEAPHLAAASAVLAQARALAPKAFWPARGPALPAIAAFLTSAPDSEILFLSDGLDGPDGADFTARLSALGAGSTEILLGRGPVLALSAVANGAKTLDVRLKRSSVGDSGARGVVVAYDAKGASIGEASYAFGEALDATAAFDLPVELRNDMARLELLSVRSAGATFLLDAGARRRRVGLVGGDAGEQPLLAPLHYLRDALAPFADLREPRPGASDPVGQLLDGGVDVLILADVAVTPALRQKLEAFLAQGGAVLRFAGPRLAAGGDDFTPARLRRGGRTLGGAMSWDKPKSLAPFEPGSPFYGLTPPPDARVARQILAEPDEGLPQKVWARLADGTPLVTAEKRGAGRLILFHVAAEPGWSNLPMTGLFVDMLKKIVENSSLVGAAAAAGEAAPLPPLRLLDGFGKLGAPPPGAKPLSPGKISAPDADHPAGFYGPPAAPVAQNAFGAPGMNLSALDLAGVNWRQGAIEAPQAIDLRPPLLMLAFLLALADGLAMLWLGRKSRAAAALALVALALGLSAPAPSKAAPSDLGAATETSLAYVETGDARTDRISREGLQALSDTLQRRTAFNPGAPRGLDPARDELAFYPLIYWPIAPDRPQPTTEAARKIEAYMKQGGLVVFDTRDANRQFPGGPDTPAQGWLKTFLKNLDLPALAEAPKDHVLFRTFYILDDLAGRYQNGPIVLEALPPDTEGEKAPARAGDSVSPLVIVANDLAAGWASGGFGGPLYPLDAAPGEENRQHEMALRAGVNLAIYALTGNYKADQVHVPELLERLNH